MLKDTILNTVGSVTYFFMQWLTTVLAARLANFETAGVYALVISFVNIFYSISIFGIRNYQISDVEKYFSTEQYLATRIITMFTALFLCIFTICISPLSKYTLGCCVAYMMFKLEEAFTDGYFAILQTNKIYRELAISYIIKGCISTVAFLVALTKTQSLLSAILWMTAGYGICIVTIDIKYCSKMGIGKPQFHKSIIILWKCIPLMFVSLSIPLMNYITRYAVEKELNSYLLGQYASLSSIVIIMGTFSGVVFIVFVPQVSEWKQKNQKYLLKQFCKYALIGMILFGMVAIFVGQKLGSRVYQIIFGSKILESMDLLIPIFLTAIILMVKTFFATMLVPLGQRWFLLIGEYSGVFLCAILAVPLTKFWGLQGTNLSYLLGTMLQLIMLGGCVLIVISGKRAETL